MSTTTTPRVRHRSNFALRYDAILTVIVAFIVGICIGMAVQFGIDHQIPACNDFIAEHGGICKGALQ